MSPLQAICKMSLPNLHTSAHLGLGVIEDVRGLLTETGCHFSGGRGGAADLLCQSNSLLLSRLLADDSSGGEWGATLEERADTG